MGGTDPDPATVEVMDASLTLYAEHGFNASTFACRVTVSTLSDLYSGIVTGIGTLKGPLHGANEEAMRMILEIGSPDKAEAWVRDALASKKKIMGFGHRGVQEGRLPRVPCPGSGRRSAGAERATTYGDIADILERVMLEERTSTQTWTSPRPTPTTSTDIPIDLYTPIFVVAASPGTAPTPSSNWRTTASSRPKAIYEGAANETFVGLCGAVRRKGSVGLGSGVWGRGDRRGLLVSQPSPTNPRPQTLSPRPLLLKALVPSSAPRSASETPAPACSTR